MCSLTKYVSDTKWTHCTVLSNNLSEQMICVYCCSNMVSSNRNHNFFLMWIWFVINFEFLDGSWLFSLHLSIHCLPEEFCGCNKQVLVVFCDGYSWVQAHNVLVSYALKYFNSLLHIHFYNLHIKKISKHVNITSHSQCKFLLSVVFLKT